MLQWAWGPALLSPVAHIAARIPSSNTGERGPRMNAECGNYLSKYDKSHGIQNIYIKQIMYLFYSITKALMNANVIIAIVMWFH